MFCSLFRIKKSCAWYPRSPVLSPRASGHWKQKTTEIIFQMMFLDDSLRLLSSGLRCVDFCPVIGRRFDCWPVIGWTNDDWPVIGTVMIASSPRSRRYGRWLPLWTIQIKYLFHGIYVEWNFIPRCARVKEPRSCILITFVDVNRCLKQI